MAFVFAGLLPLIAGSAGISIPEAGHLVTAYSLAYGIGTPIMATLTGAADRKRVIAGALVTFVLGNVAAAMSSSFAVLTAAQIVMGASAGLYAATAQGNGHHAGRHRASRQGGGGGGRRYDDRGGTRRAARLADRHLLAGAQPSCLSARWLCCA